MAPKAPQKDPFRPVTPPDPHSPPSPSEEASEISGGPNPYPVGDFERGFEERRERESDRQAPAEPPKR